MTSFQISRDGLLVHGIEIPAPNDLREAGARIQALVARLREKH